MSINIYQFLQALEDKKMRSYAVIPPLMLRTPKIVFKNENGAMEDMEQEFKVNHLKMKQFLCN